MSELSVSERANHLLDSIRAYRALIEDQSDQVSLQTQTDWQDELSKLENELATIRAVREEASSPEIYATPKSSRTPSNSFKTNPTTPSKTPRSVQDSAKAAGWTAPLVSSNTRALPSESPQSKLKSNDKTSPSAALNRSKETITTSPSRQYSMSPSKLRSPVNSSTRLKISSSDTSSNISTDSRPSTPQDASSSSIGDLVQPGAGNYSSSHLRPESRKRPFGELGFSAEDVDRSGSKSRRTTPSLSVTEQNTPGTTDDESVLFEPVFEENEDPCAGDEELARRLAAEFDQLSDYDDASIKAKQISEEQLLQARREQELLDEQYAREIQRQSSAAYYPATPSSSSSSQAIYDSKKGSFSSKNADAKASEKDLSQQVSLTSHTGSLGSGQFVPPVHSIQRVPEVFTTPPRHQIDLSSSALSGPSASSNISQAKPKPPMGHTQSEWSGFRLGQGSRSRSNGFKLPDNVDVVDLSEDWAPQVPTFKSNQVLGQVKSESTSRSTAKGSYKNPPMFKTGSAKLHTPTSSSTKTQPDDSKLLPYLPGDRLPQQSAYTYPAWGSNGMTGYQDPSALGIFGGASQYYLPSSTMPYGSAYGVAQPPGAMPYGVAYSPAPLNSTIQTSHTMPGGYPIAPYISSTPRASLISSSQTQASRQLNRLDSLDRDDDDYPNNDEMADFIYRNSSLSTNSAYYDYITNDPTKSKAEIQELLDNISGDGEIPPENREGTPDAMTYPLMEHQKVGLAWMKKAEESTNRGGILADDMGLGKTIQALALMVSMKSSDPAKKTNLIVAPVALLSQWQREIKQKLKSDHGLDSFILHGPKKANMSWTRLKQYDVVLTTYGTLASEFRSREAWEARLKDDPRLDPMYGPSLLLLNEAANWYRVICDEAQCIKNVLTKASKGACVLKADFRWCLSGTPMQNNLGELHALIKFCRIRPFNDQKKFNGEIVYPIIKSHSQVAKESAMRKLQALIKAILLRRNKKSTIDGKPILTLPDRVIEVQHSVFSDDERDFYRALETQVQLQFNKYLQAGTVGRNYSNALVLLLRLRQACCHPFLTRDFAETGPDLSNIDGSTLEGMIKVAKDLRPEVVERIIEAVPHGFECPICYDASENPRIISPCGHDTCSECLSRLMDNASVQALAEGNHDGSGQAKCPECRAVLTKAITDLVCFRKVHMPEMIAAEDAEDANLMDILVAADESDSDSDTSDESDSDLDDFVVSDGHETSDGGEDSGDESMEELDWKRELAKKKLAGAQKDAKEDSGSEYEEADEQDTSKLKSNSEGQGKDKAKTITRTRSKSEAKSKSLKDAKGKGKRKAKSAEKKKRPKEKETKTLGRLKAESSRNKESKKKYMKYLKKTWETSGKIEKCVEILRSIREADRTEKTIIFSQWTSLLDLLEVPVSAQKWRFERYDGSMSASARNDAVINFTDNPRCNIMLVSLKAGNSGLNLTSASQVVILDPFWNPYIEEQAIDRAHRIGQQRVVTVHRLYVEETVENRILELQKKKRDLIDGALDEKASQSIGRLGVRELASLFGISSDNVPSNAR